MSSQARIRYELREEERVCFSCCLPECRERHPGCAFSRIVKARQNEKMLARPAQALKRNDMRRALRMEQQGSGK